MITILITIWLSTLTGYVIILNRIHSNLKEKIKYLLPFVQDKTLKALTTYIEDDNDELIFDENGELVEKTKETIKIEENGNSLFNKNFTKLPEDCKASSIEKAIEYRLVHKIAKYRLSIEREQITTTADKICLNWKPGTVFAQDDTKQIYIISKYTNPIILYSDINSDWEGTPTIPSLENFPKIKLELLALPEEYLYE